MIGFDSSVQHIFDQLSQLRLNIFQNVLKRLHVVSTLMTITGGIVVWPVWINCWILKHYFENEVSVLGNASKGLRRSCKYTLHNFFLFCSMSTACSCSKVNL